MKHTKLVALFMAIVMTMGLMTTAASAAEDEVTIDDVMEAVYETLEDGKKAAEVIADDERSQTVNNWLKYQKYGDAYIDAVRAAAIDYMANAPYKYDEAWMYANCVMAMVDKSGEFPIDTDVRHDLIDTVTMKPHGNQEDNTPDTSAPVPEPSEKPVRTITFDDVPDDAWYAEAVYALAEGGLLAGIGDNKFNPNGNVTAGEVATVMMRVYGENTATKKGDVHWAATAMWDMSLTGNDLRYPFNDELLNDETKSMRDRIALHADTVMTREYTISSLYSLTGHMSEYATYADSDDVMLTWGLNTNNEWTPNNYGLLMSGPVRLGNIKGMFYHKQVSEKVWTPYDIPDINDCTHEAYRVFLAYNSGIVNGVDETGRCNPNAFVTRAEFAQMLYNMGVTHAGQAEHIFMGGVSGNSGN